MFLMSCAANGICEKWQHGATDPLTLSQLPQKDKTYVRDVGLQVLQTEVVSGLALNLHNDDFIQLDLALDDFFGDEVILGHAPTEVVRLGKSDLDLLSDSHRISPDSWHCSVSRLLASHALYLDLDDRHSAEGRVGVFIRPV